jgi:hypothetical protein
LALVLGGTACDSNDPNDVASSPLDGLSRDAGVRSLDTGGDPILGAIRVVSPLPGSLHGGAALIEIVLEPAAGTTIAKPPVAVIGGTSLMLAPGTAPNQWIGTIESFDLPSSRSRSALGEEQLLRLSAQDSMGETLAATVRFSFDD